MKIEIYKPSKEELENLKVKSWSIWECEPSEFDWHYDENERCYILEGEVVVKTKEGEVRISKGDMVLFPKGLSCKWQVKKKIRKHYRFE